MRRLVNVDNNIDNISNNDINNNVDDIEYKIEIKNIESENIKVIGMTSINNNNFMFIMIDSIQDVII